MAKQSEVVALQNDIRSLVEELNLVKANRDYFRGQLSASSDAWSKKYLALEENTLRVSQALTTEAMRFVTEQAWKDGLKIEQARTEAINQCFKHVASLLRDRPTVGQ